MSGIGDEMADGVAGFLNVVLSPVKGALSAVDKSVIQPTAKVAASTASVAGGVIGGIGGGVVAWFKDAKKR